MNILTSVIQYNLESFYTEPWSNRSKKKKVRGGATSGKKDNKLSLFKNDTIVYTGEPKETIGASKRIW